MHSEKSHRRQRERTSRRLCIVGLVFCWLVGLAALAVGIYLVQTGGVISNRPWIAGAVLLPDEIAIPGGIAATFNSYARELAPLGLNIVVTICNDITGYIHTISLRWALQRELRLTFNSNLRLFTSARKSKANAWYTNTAMAIFMIMSYTSTSMVFLGDAGKLSLLPRNTNTFICGWAAIALAVSILGQAVVATVCIPSLAKVHAWSSDPLENTAACIAAGSLCHRSGRCMRAVHHSAEAAKPILPLHRQGSAYSAHKEVRVVFWYMIIPIVLAAIWGGVIFRFAHSSGGDATVGDNWSVFPNVADNYLESLKKYWATETTSYSMPLPIKSFAQFCLAFIVIAAIQALMTMSLHCAELIVNVTRDERSWRMASRKGRRCTNALFSVLQSFPALVLFALKPLIHWFYSLACASTFSWGINMRAPQIFYLGAAAGVLALFTAICALWRPSGPQPAAYGHLQTLADLVDVWPEEGKLMFWGAKGADHWPLNMQASVSSESCNAPEEAAEQMSESADTEKVCHAGTAAEPLEPIDFSKRYMGTRPRLKACR